MTYAQCMGLCSLAERMQILPVESKERDLIYFVDKEDRDRLGVVTTKGKIILTRAQIEAIANEALEVMDL